MSDIKTWIERCEEHPDHQSGMISDGMIRARMCEEIADLRAEIERLRAEVQRQTRHVEQLYDQIRRRADERDKAQIEVVQLREALEGKP